MRRIPDHIAAPLKIAGIYTVAAGLWILFSDKFVARLVSDPEHIIRLSIYKGWGFVIVTAAMLYLLIRHYITALREQDDRLRRIIEGVSATTGEEFFASLVQHLAEALRADYALVAELAGGEQPAMKTIAVFGKGHPMENFTYTLAGTPCSKAISNPKGICFHASGIRREFPDDTLLADLGVEGYIGTPLVDAAGRTMGVMSLMSCRPLPGIESAESLFRLFAVRAAAELERRQAEQELREAAVKYRIVADNTYDWEFWTSAEERILYMSPSCRRVTGHGADEFQADPDLLRRIIHPDDEPAFTAHRRDILAAMKPGELEFRIIPSDSSVRWIHHFCQPVFDDNGTFLGIRGSNHDITASKQAREALKAQFDEISTIFDSLNALVFVVDTESDALLYLNRFGASLFGVDWLGKTCAEVLQRGEYAKDSFCGYECSAEIGTSPAPCVWDFLSTVTGRWYQCTERTIKWPDGRVVRLEIAVDISDQKEVERMKDEMISAVSHEMRTPLTAMMGFTEFMLDSEVPEEQRRSFLTTIHKETARLNELISNFLDLQQIKARQATYRFRPVAVEPLLRDAAALFAADHDQHRIVVVSPEDLPLVRGDEPRLHQILTNLISNAVKYSPRGSRISLGARSEGNTVTFWVTDEGQGIPPELQGKIFDRFYRLDNTDSRLVGGTGLGLSLVKELVAAHNGRVWVESVPGKGSTFNVSLPIFTGNTSPSAAKEES